MAFRPVSLLQGVAVATLSDLLLVWKFSPVLEGHSRVVETLLRWAAVPWERGSHLEVWPGVWVPLLRTRFLDYQDHPLYPWYFLAATVLLFLIGLRRWPTPLKPLLFTLPASLAITLFYLNAVSPTLPYNSQDFCALWYHGEAYLWLLLPWIAALGFFLISVPLGMKLSWLLLLMIYSFWWSAVRLAFALATFYYIGSFWMPFYYFAFGFLADFLYIVAFYSLAADRAAERLALQREVWRC